MGRKLGEKTLDATTIGHTAAIMWAHEQFGIELIWGIEHCRNMSARLERDLLSAGQVVRVPIKLMAQVRRSARTRGKSDPIDARAVLRYPDGTVTLVEKWSGTVGFGAAAMKQRSVVHLSGNDGRGDFPPDREAVSHLGTPFGCGQSVPARPKMR